LGALGNMYICTQAVLVRAHYSENKARPYAYVCNDSGRS
jgi:hypothetical protein